MADNARKRKPDASNSAPLSKRPRFPPNLRRNIPSARTSTAYPNGEINVRNFLKSHENEIKSLESAMKTAKQGLSRRAFQDVPRDLRRRTASHNPQRVPKRLRTRSKREIVEDNTPISKGSSGSGIGKGKKKWLRKNGMEKSRQAWERRTKRRKEKTQDEVTVEPMEGIETENSALEASGMLQKKVKTKNKPFPTLAKPEMPPSRFRRRQINKTWLPTHVWHSKRAFITPPKEPLWHFAIPLAPNVKAYRLTHRAAALRGAVAWDMSYMATIGLKGTEAGISGVLRALHFAKEDEEDPWQGRGKGKKWKAGTRAWEGWIYERQSEPNLPIAFVTVIWCAPETETNKRKALIRVHPGAFLQLWNTVIRASKVQKPAVTTEDLRFELGSIEIIGPAAAETLCSILCPCASSTDSSIAPEALWKSLAGVTNPEALPSGALLAFPIIDPRLRDPPLAIDVRQDEEAQTTLLETLSQWPIDMSQTASPIFDRGSRLAASRSLPSHQSINRRKSSCTTGGYPELRSTDPQIPTLTYTSRRSKSWTVLLPWKCVPLIWRGIMRYPVSCGGNPRFGGLRERRQVGFERSSPSFPFDHPGTVAGWDWELQERAAREHDWKKHPKGKRIEWSTIDLGNGRRGEVGDPWACAWERLCSQSHEHAMKDTTSNMVQTCFRQLPSQKATDLLAGGPIVSRYLENNHLIAVKISMRQRGTPTNCARVYRLPSNNPELRRKWVALYAGDGSVGKTQQSCKKSSAASNAGSAKRFRNQRVAERLLEPTPAVKDDYPAVPDEEDLIGFVTTGNYNLAEGMPTAIANIMLARLFVDKTAVAGKQGLSTEDHICIVREAGRTIGRLATWTVV